MKSTMLKLIAVLGSAWLIAGCASGPRAPLERDAQARLFRPVADKAVVYVFRNDGWFWVGPKGVTLDGRDMGALGTGTYFRWELPPGTHQIVSRTEPPAILAFETHPGGIYFVWQDIYPPVFHPHNRLDLVDYTTTQQALEHCVLLESK